MFALLGHLQRLANDAMTACRQRLPIRCMQVGKLLRKTTIECRRVLLSTTAEATDYDSFCMQCYTHSDCLQLRDFCSDDDDIVYDGHDTSTSSPAALANNGDICSVFLLVRRSRVVVVPCGISYVCCRCHYGRLKQMD